MCEVFWYLIIAMLEVVVTVKMRIAKYISDKLTKMISADEAYIRLQYFCDIPQLGDSRYHIHFQGS